MSETLDFGAIPPGMLAAYYGLLFAMAAADGRLHPDEAAAIRSSLDLEPLPAALRERVRDFSSQPPGFRAALGELRGATDELRHGVFVGLVDLALADGELDRREAEALELCALELGISIGAARAVERFLRALQPLRGRDAREEAVADAFEKASEDLAAAGVPAAAAYFSALVNERIASGDEAALAALGLGLGLIPGLGVAVALHAGTRVGVSQLLSGDAGAPEHLSEARRRRALAGLERLGRDIEELDERLEDARGEGRKAQADALEDRLAALRQLAKTRRSALED